MSLIWANDRLMRELESDLQAEHGFTLGEYDVLVHLADAPKQRRRMCDLADAVLLSPSGLSRRVERLERAGLVERCRSERDHRSVEAQLTSAGKRLFRRLSAAHRRGIKERFVDNYTPDELEQLTELLGRVAGRSGSGE
jgi:DNA-binding MarR family transcriptional regulator